MMPDLPDYYTQTTTPYVTALGLQGGAEVSLPASPIAKEVYIATDTDRLWYAIADGAWRSYFMSARILTANSLLYATTAYTPIALSVAASRLVGRKATGNMGALTGAEVMAILSGQAGANFSLNSKKLTSVADPTANQDAATKKYTDDGLALYLPLAGGIMSGAIAMGTNSITGLPAPTGSGHAARKSYVDTAATTAVNNHKDLTTGVHGVGAGAVVGTTLTQVLTNKTLTAPVINGTVTGASLVLPAHTSGAISLSAAVGLVRSSDVSALYICGGTDSTSATIQLFGKSHASTAGRLAITTPNASLVAAFRLVISGAIDTAVASWSAITHTGLVLSGALNANSQQITNLGSITFGDVRALQTGVNALDYFQFKGYDADNTTYRHVGRVQGGVNDPYFALGGGQELKAYYSGVIALSTNLAMGSNKLTGLAAGAASGESARYDELHASSQSVVTGSRALDTDYQNATGKTMIVTVEVHLDADEKIKVYVEDDSTPAVYVAGALNGNTVHIFTSITFLVPAGWYYQVAADQGSPTFEVWTEWTLH